MNKFMGPKRAEEEEEKNMEVYDIWSSHYCQVKRSINLNYMNTLLEYNSNVQYMYIYIHMFLK